MRGVLKMYAEPETPHDVLLLLLAAIFAVGVVAGLSPRDRMPRPRGRLLRGRNPRAAGRGMREVQSEVHKSRRHPLGCYYRYYRNVSSDAGTLHPKL